jgi:hypothetical protein
VPPRLASTRAGRSDTLGGVAGRTLLSAALAAFVGAVLLATLALHLNIGLVLREEAAAILLCLVLPWTLAGSVLLALVAAAASALGSWRAFPPLLRRRLAFLALSAAAVLYWSNLRAYHDALPARALQALALSATAITSAAAVLVVVGLHALLFPGRERAPAGALVILAPTLAVALALALRPEAPPQAPVVGVSLEAAQAARRIIVLGIDGLGVSDLTGNPSLVPLLTRLARRGALGSLATLRPNEGPPLWTTLMTGRYPRDHGVLSATSYRLFGSSSDWHLLPKGAAIGLLERAGLVRPRPVTSAARKRRALWNVLDAFGIPTGLVRVWATQPPEAIQGFVVSPYFHLVSGEPARASAALYPRDLLKEVAARMVRATDIDPALLAGLAEGASGDSPLADPRLRALAESALAPDLSYERAAFVLNSTYRPSLLVISFNGYDSVGHSFYREAHPEAFGDVRPQDARRYGHVLERYASLLGGFVGDWQKELVASDVLLVVSTHGLEPTPLWRRLLGTLSGTQVAAASHASAPPGLLLAVGEGIRPGALLGRASVLDVAPTLLYLLGLPVPRDMQGRVLTEMLDPDFASEHPVTFIPSYEGLAVTPAVAGAPLDALPPLPEEQESR